MREIPGGGAIERGEVEKDPDEMEVDDPDGRTDIGCIGVMGVGGITGRGPALTLEADPLPLPLPFEPREEVALVVRGVSGLRVAAQGEALLALRGEGEPSALLLLLMERCKFGLDI